MATRSKRRSLGLLLLAVLALGGCDYFRPSQPEVGGDIVPPVPTDYSNPEATLTTVQLAIQDKSASTGTTAYAQAFANPVTDGQGFTTTFDASTLARFTAPDVNWNFEREQIFYSKLSQLDASFKFVFGWGHDFPRAPPDDIGTSAATVYRSYSLRATTDGSVYVYEAYGYAEIHLALLNNKWKIVTWIDFEFPQADFNAGQKSFGFLRLSGPSS